MALENGDFGGLWDDEEPIPLTTAFAPRPGRNRDQATTHAAMPPQARPVTAAALTADLIVRPPRERPLSGWRRALFQITSGLINLPPAAADVRQRELHARLKTPVTGCRRIAFLSRKGGVGKTSTCLLTGHTFALHRGDRVVCLDANPDAGTLGHRLRRQNTATVTTLLADADRIERYADIRAHTSQAPTRLEVVAADDDPSVNEALRENDYHNLIALLDRHYNLLLLDTGTGVLESATRGVLDAADQLVIVTNPSLDGARAASLTLDWLDRNDYQQLAANAVAVLTAVRPFANAVDLDRIEDHFRARCRSFIRIPWDPHLESGAEIDHSQLAHTSKDAYLTLAAELASTFPDPSPRRR